MTHRCAIKEETIVIAFHEHSKSESHLLNIDDKALHSYLNKSPRFRATDIQETLETSNLCSIAPDQNT